MRKSKSSESTIITILKAVEAGRTVRDVCREYEVSEATYYNWKEKFGGMEAADIQRPRELEEENHRLKQMCAELSLDHWILKDVLTNVRTLFRLPAKAKDFSDRISLTLGVVILAL